MVLHNGEVLEKTQIEVGQSWAADRVPPDIPEAAYCVWSESFDVEVLVEFLIFGSVIRQLPYSNQVGPIDANAGSRIVGSRGDVKR